MEEKKLTAGSGKMIETEGEIEAFSYIEEMKRMKMKLKENSVIMFDANRTFNLWIILSSLLIAGLIALNIYQFVFISDLRVENERSKMKGVFTEQIDTGTQNTLQSLYNLQKNVQEQTSNLNNILLDGMRQASEGVKNGR